VSAAARDCRVEGDGVSHYVYLMTDNHEEETLMHQHKYDSGKMETPCTGFRYVQLEEGDNLYLKYYTPSGNTGMHGLKFCVSLYTTTE